MLFKVKQDLIDKELRPDISDGFEFHYHKLSNKFLDWLFRHYYIFEMCENFYDMEDCKTDDERMKRITWQDPYGEGIWEWNQQRVDDFGRGLLELFRKFPKSIKNRLYYSKKEDEIKIYFYARDCWFSDYWFIFKKRKKRL